MAWSPPVNDGGSHVVRYFVRGVPEAEEGHKTPKPIEVHTEAGHTSATIDKLKGNTKYTFRIYALNSAGLSPPSAVSEVMMTAPVSPGPPTDLMVEEATASSLKLRWQAPNDNGGAVVEKYNVEVFMQASK